MDLAPNAQTKEDPALLMKGSHFTTDEAPKIKEIEVGLIA
jgi:hypothetical protein